MKDIYAILMLCLISLIGISNVILFKDIKRQLIHIENIIEEHDSNEGEQNG